MMDPRKIGQLLMGEWNKTEQPLEERAGILPIGKYQDGSVGMAWPGIIADPAKRVGNALDAAFKGDQNYYFGDDGHLTNDAIMAGIDATGLAMTGGLGAGLVGGFADNAVGSAGGKLTQPQGIRAYHGSPHDFDRFDLSKIGTGEGAQAYGHGLYFADSEDVAKGYRERLATSAAVVDGNVLRTGDLADTLKAKGVSDDAAEMAVWYGNRGYSVNDYLKELQVNFPADYERAAPILQKTPGRMYEVNIKANPEDFLDWDKPLSQQSEAVRRAIEQVTGKKVDPDAIKAYNDALYSALFDDAPAPLPREPWDITGASLYNMFGAGKAGTTQALREAGIPGIKYLDGMSRGAGEGSSNYVVFDDQLIDILRKYANAPTGAVVPAGLEATDQDTDLNPVLLQYLKAIGLQ